MTEQLFTGPLRINQPTNQLLSVGVRVSMTFHLMFVHYYKSVWVAKWPPFGKELPTQLTICSLCFLTICNVSISRLGLRIGFAF